METIVLEDEAPAVALKCSSKLQLSEGKCGGIVHFPKATMKLIIDLTVSPKLQTNFLEYKNL